MVILDCWKHHQHHLFCSSRREARRSSSSSPPLRRSEPVGRRQRPPSPGCHCSCHVQQWQSLPPPPVLFPVEYSSLATDSYYESHRNGIYSSVPAKRSEPFKRSISTYDLNTSSYEPVTLRQKNHQKNLLLLVKIDPFRFAAMEPLHVDKRIIVFSLLDTFTKLSPNKILENYVKRLKDESHISTITVFNLSEPIQYMRDSIAVPICEYGWPERRAPSLERLCSLCKAIDSWLSMDRDRNLAIIYSKRDLSRASLAVAVFLQYVRICLGSAESFFDFETMYEYYRNNLQSYLQPSQLRYVEYFKSLLSGDTKINNKKFCLNQIVLRKIPNFDGSGLCKPFIKVYQGWDLVYSSPILDIDHHYGQRYDYIVFDIQPPLRLRGEILVKCYHKIIVPSSRTEMFSFQFHTGTLVDDHVVVFHKPDIDIAAYDKRFADGTRVELIFNDAQPVELPPHPVALLEDDSQVTKCNSYENFFSDETCPQREYTKGPLDGSLYATVSKIRGGASVSQVAQPVITATGTTVTEEEVVLDELLDEIFTEIQSFPDPVTHCPSPSKINYDYSPSVSKQKTPVAVAEDELDSVDFDSTDENLDWLQRQQLKLKKKQQQQQLDGQPAPAPAPPKQLIEMRLMEELKSTIIKNGGARCREPPPEVPTRTSSRNIIARSAISPEQLPEFSFSNGDNESSLYAQVVRRSGEIDSPKQTPNQIRSSTPNFPARPSPPTVPKEQETGTRSHQVPMFIRDTSSFWYKPNITREDAVKYLLDKPPGWFIIRDSNSFANAYGLAVRVPEADGSLSDPVPVRHFLIESTNKGVQIKGCAEEPAFSSLAALVHQHSITRISLPVVLKIPTISIGQHHSDKQWLYDNGAACNVLYFSTATVPPTVSGVSAIERTIDGLLAQPPTQVKPAVVHFKASSKGITLTDNSHRLFFRQHYPMSTISFCGVDRDNRTWIVTGGPDRQPFHSHLFGFVTRKPGNEQICLLFGHYEPDQVAHDIVDFVNKLMMQSSGSYTT